MRRVLALSLMVALLLPEVLPGQQQTVRTAQPRQIAAGVPPRTRDPRSEATWHLKAREVDEWRCSGSTPRGGSPLTGLGNFEQTGVRS